MLYALFLLLGAVLLLLVLAALRRAVELLPMSADRRDLVARASPAVGTAIVLVYAAFAFAKLVGDGGDAGAAALGVVALIVVAAAWPALRDVASGIVLKSGRACRPGDHVRVSDIQGRVSSLGLRTLTIETSDGDEAVVPYSRIVRETLFREPAQEHAAHHVFHVELADGTSLREAKERARVAALHVHWQSVVREPQMSALDERTLEITVFPIHPDRGPDIESAVRRAIGPKPPAPRATTRPEPAEKPS